MMYIESLEEKTNEISDTDIMVIEDKDDTKKVSIGNLKKAINQNIDETIIIVKEEIQNDFKNENEKLREQLESVSSAYYGLVRNYEFLNSAYEELKEMFNDYISKTIDKE